MLLVFWLSVHSPYLHSELIKHKALEMIKQNVLTLLQHRNAFRFFAGNTWITDRYSANSPGRWRVSNTSGAICNVVGINVNNAANDPNQLCKMRKANFV
jgi:hypothetical protein